ncbi:hypothetical protein PRIPAC_91257 [Pristionchus pacificus]|uniref:Uncharacterized protein n=1 Tax=Pristionchus pacificus TaxID=54126 RepID=A0A2A6B5Q9_PRIPA|nr:hypothetical protein PRIPAC_91257 [Pristionchus pacificus]|eukprot:PDM61188.1 hypothetical protein PRIPAC_50630 [Pristionchus pacificus]
MYTKLLLLAIVLWGIWTEYEEMSRSFESPDNEAESLQGKAPTRSRKLNTKSKEDDAKEKLIKAIFQVFLLRGMRRKLVTPGTPADAILIAVSMMFMIGLLCVVWFVFIFGVIKVFEPIWDRITTFREDRSESRQRESELEEFRTAYVEHEKQNPTTAIVRRGGRNPTTH